ncbi:molybdate ABC transporter substrate-binding protein [Euzebya tangerina]|uniref:molybdate ABC transporter substrate-binding protein n=1 Tax=Euzebya tangerina TaxID=591198 RepID=UPI000E31D273|nr:molybdate ABC transporter substrate-binding protein [Euzebya tangerina]
MKVRQLGALVVAVVLLGGCGTGGASEANRPPASADTVTGEVVISAAASLTEAFGELADVFEEEHPAAEVTLNLAGSQVLAAQIVQGAPVDVFASANQTQMDVVLEEGLAADAVPFATNRLAIAVADGNPLGVRGLADLADPDLVMVLANPDVPAGAAATDVLDRAGVQLTPASLEPDVRAALSKVELGEADAAVVYASDLVTSSDGIEGVMIPDPPNTTVTYPVARLEGAANPRGADDFVALLLSDQGQQILRDHGFGGPG